MKVFNNLKMVTKLVGGFGIVLLLFGVVMSIYHATVTKTSQNFNNLMDVNVAVAGKSSETQALMKQCRIDEKNFLSSLDTHYLEKLKTSIGQLKKIAQQIQSMSSRADNKTMADQVNQIQTFVTQYSDNFASLVLAYENRGLDSQSGLRGKFEEAAVRFVKEMAYVDVEDLYVHMLRVIQVQNEYGLSGDADYLERLDQLVNDYAGVIVKSAADEEMIKDTLKEVIGNYRKALDTIIQSSDQTEKMAKLGSLKEIISEIDDVFSVTYLPNAKPLILKIRSSEKDYMLFGGEVYTQKVYDAIEDLSKTIDASNIIDDYKKNSHTYLNLYRQAFQNLVSEDQKIAGLYADMTQAANRIESLVEKLSQNASVLAAKGTTQVNINASSRSSLALMIGIGAIILGVFLSFIITRLITNPIIEAVGFSKRMSSGDFTQNLEIHQKDEIGVLSSALNEIVTNIGTMIRNILNDVNVLTRSSTDLSSISEKMSGGTDQMASKFSSVSGAAEEMSSSLNSFAVTIEEMSTNLNSVSSATELNTATINEISGHTDEAQTISEQAVSQAKKAGVDMKNLEEAAGAIGSVTETIINISEQTNLLALNATIEAARAGEAGKGFTVVANEIKTLAQQTSEATSAISTKISGIQNTTAVTIQSIEEITQIITRINDTISNISAAIAEHSSATIEINENVGQASLGIQDASENVAQCSIVANEISADISSVNQEAVEMSMRSTQLNSSAEDLAEMALKLKKMVEQFEV